MNRRVHISVRMGFERRTLAVGLADVRPLKLVTEEVKRSKKYRQIAASIAEIGLVEVFERQLGAQAMNHEILLEKLQWVVGLDVGRAIGAQQHELRWTSPPRLRKASSTTA